MSPRPTYVIPCSGAKLDHAAPARELYTGTMFRYTLAKTSRAAELLGGRVVILSALYGLVNLDNVLEPYDMTLKRTGTDLQLAMRVRGQLITSYGSITHAVMCLPQPYRNAFDYAARTAAQTGLRGEVVAVDAFAGCRGIGEQRGRLAQLVAELEQRHGVLQLDSGTQVCRRCGDRVDGLAHPHVCRGAS